MNTCLTLVAKLNTFYLDKKAVIPSMKFSTGPEFVRDAGNVFHSTMDRGKNECLNVSSRTGYSSNERA